jgi:ATP-dependent DNA helicase RecG
MTNYKLNSPIQELSGVGQATAKLLTKLHITTIKDALMNFPREYDDRRNLPTISQLKQGHIQSVFAIIERITEKKIKKKAHIIEAILVDKSGRTTAVWFNQAYLLKILVPGQKVLVRGKIDRSLFSQTDIIQVQHTELLRSSKEIKDNIGIIMPVYSLTAGVYQTQIRHIVRAALKLSPSLIKDALPERLKRLFNLESLNRSLIEIHYPKSVNGYKKARHTIVFNEFFYYQLRLESQRLEHQKHSTAITLKPTYKLINLYLNSLNYELTTAQKRVVAEIIEDITSRTAMNRLLQGDVGAGKTDVAIISLLCAIENNLSGALMAPTEILATQHYFRIKNLLERYGINCCLLKGKMRKKEKELMLEIINSKEPCIIVGTHALIENYVDLSQCGLIVIDEQHRFGVIQRIRLQEKGCKPHCLFMTATPIPRSFMLTCFGDLDKSIIDELPPGRTPVKTVVSTQEYLPHIFQICYQRLLESEQIYIVYPLVEESEKIDLQSVAEGVQTVSKCFPNHKVGFIHGRMKSNEKEGIMADFKQNKINILVSTTVIEVGIDVPNATMMIIQHADRFGLSQLHQLRGRIGRGSKQSLCYLITNVKSDLSSKRLNAIASTTDGFKIAEYDLSIRGPGDILGTKQTGMPNFKLADLVQDEKTLVLARKVAKQLLHDDPELITKDNQLIKQELIKYEDSIIGKYLN